MPDRPEPSSRFSSRLWPLDKPPRNVYVAAPLTCQVDALRLALQLVDAGFRVTSSWLRNDFSDRPKEDHWERYSEYEERWGEADLRDLAESDTLIILANNPSTHGGYHVELGYFLGSDKGNVIVVGDRPNVFFYTNRVRFVLGAEQMLGWLVEESGRTDWDEPLLKAYVVPTVEKLVAPVEQPQTDISEDVPF